MPTTLKAAISNYVRAANLALNEGMVDGRDELCARATSAQLDADRNPLHASHAHSINAD